MADDIVTLLRKYQPYSKLHGQAADAIVRLTAEREEARKFSTDASFLLWRVYELLASKKFDHDAFMALHNALHKRVEPGSDVVA